MEIHVYDTNLEWVRTLDSMKSVLWVERYREVGKFEIELPLEFKDDETIVAGNYLQIKGEDRFMIIEDINPSESLDEAKLVISGPSGDNILSYRIILEAMSLSGNVNDVVRGLVQDNFISPTDPKRVIPNVSWLDTAELQSVVDFPVSDIFETGTILEIILKLCLGLNVGFKITLTDDLEVSLYSGKDRSHLQSILPRVVFSKAFDNILAESVLFSEGGVKNHITVFTDDAVASLQAVPVYITDTEPEGLARKEGYRSLSVTRSVVSPPLNDTEVLDIITSNGSDILIDLQPKAVFDGDLDTSQPFVYGEDFILGDLVQCDILGTSIRARIVERVVSLDESGPKEHIAFEFDI